MSSIYIQSSRDYDKERLYITTMKNLFVSMNASIIIVLLVNTYIITSFASRNHHIAAPKDGDAHYSHDKSVMEAFDRK